MVSEDNVLISDKLVVVNSLARTRNSVQVDRLYLNARGNNKDPTEILTKADEQGSFVSRFTDARFLKGPLSITLKPREGASLRIVSQKALPKYQGTLEYIPKRELTDG